MSADCSRRRFLAALGAGALALAAPKRGRAETRRRPNVILILSDDQGTLDMKCYGSEDLSTPHMDALARRGTRFSQFYVGAPVCSPSRAALLTGRTPQRAQLTTNAGGEAFMPGAQVTIAEVLRDAGYATALFGKWHLGKAAEASPLEQGFDEYLGHKQGCIDNYSHFFYWSGPNRHDLWRNDIEYWEDGSYFPDMVVRETCRFIETHQDEPFFVFVPFNIPHYPLQGQAPYRALYEDVEEPRASYAALVSTLDAKLGTIVEKVDRLGLRDDTLIIFLSDHGHSVEERTNFGGGNAGRYRGHKFTHWEGGIRVPCVASWPGRIPEGAVRGQMAVSMDWLPTIAHFCGAALPDRPLDGKCLADVIAKPEAPSPHTVLHWQLGKRWAVREGDWKLVGNGPASEHLGKELPEVPLFLSNLAEDATETVNLADQHPEIVARLEQLHEDWAAHGAQQ